MYQYLLGMMQNAQQWRKKIYGSLKTYEDAVFLCLGTGIGAGVFLDNKLLVPKKNTDLK